MARQGDDSRYMAGTDTEVTVEQVMFAIQDMARLLDELSEQIDKLDLLANSGESATNRSTYPPTLNPIRP